jgi:hypothetical protein
MRNIWLIIIGLNISIAFGFASSKVDGVVSEDELQRTVERIENEESLLLNYEMTRRSIRLANRLNKLASSSDLQFLVDSSNPSVSCLAFLLLKKRKDPFAQVYYDRYRNMTEAEWLEWNRGINRINRKHKSDVVTLYSKADFLEDVYIKGIFLSKIK